MKDLKNRIALVTGGSRGIGAAVAIALANAGADIAVNYRERADAANALAWILAHKPWIVPIPGTTKLHRVKENLGAANVELTVDDLRRLDDATSKISIQGARYPENLQKLVGR